jgi:hypothetical protein
MFNTLRHTHFRRLFTPGKCSQRNLNLFIGLNATGVPAFVFNSSHNSVDCESTLLSHGFSEKIPDHPQTITIPHDKNFNILKKIEEAVNWVVDFLKLLTRVGWIAIFFTPAVVTSPTLLFNSPLLESHWWEMVRSGIFFSGPCLTKLSQWIATRPDLFPQRLCKELELLQTKTHHHRWEDTVKMLNELYGPNWNKYLIIQDTDVAGSGLMAQVYHGYLHSNQPHQHDIEIALKILHPGVQEAIREDLILLEFLVHSLETTVDWLTFFYTSLPLPFSSSSSSTQVQNTASIFNTTIPLTDALFEFQHLMSAQVDFQAEAEAMIKFKHNFSKRKWNHRVKFAEPIDLKYFLQTGHYYPDPAALSPVNQAVAPLVPLEFPLKGESGKGGVLIQTFEHGIPMATYLTETKLAKDKKVIPAKPIQTNKQRNHRLFPTINGALTTSFFPQVEQQEGSIPSLQKPVDEVVSLEKHTQRDKEIAALGLDLILKMVGFSDLLTLSSQLLLLLFHSSLKIISFMVTFILGIYS